MLHPKDGDHFLTSVTIDENCLLPCHVCVIILVTNGHCQGAGNCFGWTAAVTHNNRNEEFLLALTVKHPQSCKCCSAIKVVLEIEIIAVAILGG